jgi:hypothetical protein
MLGRSEGYGLYRLRKNPVFIRSEGYGLQPVHKGTKNNGL